MTDGAFRSPFNERTGVGLSDGARVVLYAHLLNGKATFKHWTSSKLSDVPIPVRPERAVVLVDRLRSVTSKSQNKV